MPNKEINKKYARFIFLLHLHFALSIDLFLDFRESLEMFIEIFLDDLS